MYECGTCDVPSGPPWHKAQMPAREPAVEPDRVPAVTLDERALGGGASLSCQRPVPRGGEVQVEAGVTGSPRWAVWGGDRGLRPPRAEDVQGASFRGWKEVTSLFNKDDEQHLLERCKSPKSKGTNLRLREELKTEKKSGFWDNLVLKQNIQSKKPDEIEGWEPPVLAPEDVTADTGEAASGRPPRPGWEEDAKGRSKYSSLASSGNSSRWSLRSAGRLVGIRRQSRGHLTDNWEELE
ncbi:testis development-related protein [Neomonachus schauinslandi]|uniref:Testis development-related protein n=1 Tax=Neomonachus schauinslandi TaxID=29088 RepID=A0A2Y9HDI5_NEOSC|nr:testis development-related protein [Neomonachus schauinslandi]